MKKILFSLLSLSFFLFSCGSSGSSVDIINPDAEYQYFYGATCPHCQELNGFVQDEDLFSKISVEKKEVYFNDANRDEFLALTKKLGLSEKETGVPFVYDKISGKHAVGAEPALNLFKSRLENNTITGSGETQKSIEVPVIPQDVKVSTGTTENSSGSVDQ